MLKLSEGTKDEMNQRSAEAKQKPRCSVLSPVLRDIKEG